MRAIPGSWLTRRQAMTALSAGALALGTGRATPSIAGRAEIAHGRVFADEHGDGLRRVDDRGIAGVLVSNGRDVVLTDSDGGWALPVAEGEYVFVVGPSGWQISGSPREFAYLHQPNGTPLRAGLRQTGVEATGRLRECIDFRLKRVGDEIDFEALLFADTQAANAVELDYVRRLVLESAVGTSAAFAISHGDVMGDDLSLLPDYLDILKQSRLTWHHCPGNHDMNLEATDPAFAFETWKRHIGPTHYAFQHGDATFILLNNIEYFGAGRVGSSGRGYRGRIGPAQLQFVENVLRRVPEDHLIVVSMHIPLVSFDAPHSAADTTADRDTLLSLLSRRAFTASFAGHSHTTEHHYLGAAHGFAGPGLHHHHVLTAASGSWWSGPKDARGIPVADSRDGSPKGFHVLSVEGNRYSTRFVPFDAAADTAMRAMLIEEGRDAQWRTLVVNVFDGGPNTTVTCNLDDGPTLTLARTTMADPHVSDLFSRHRDLCKPWVEAAPSSHVWMVPLAADAQTSRCVTLRVKDEMGRSYTRSIVLGATHTKGSAASPIRAG